jgi:DNA-directed RNA polymerase specialized sigma24 family protein
MRKNPVWKLRPKQNYRELTNQDIEFLCDRLIKTGKWITAQPIHKLSREQEDRVELIHKRFTDLTHIQMKIFNQKVFMRLSYRQIAKNTGKSHEGVRKIYFKSLEIIRKGL